MEIQTNSCVLFATGFTISFQLEHEIERITVCLHPRVKYFCQSIS